MSPASLIAAYMDWVAHLAISPGKQQLLLEKAARKPHRLLLYAQQSVSSSCQCVPCIEPLPQDQRFSHPDWQRWPADEDQLRQVVNGSQQQQNLRWSRNEVDDVVYYLNVTQYSY